MAPNSMEPRQKVTFETKSLSQIKNARPVPVVIRIQNGRLVLEAYLLNQLNASFNKTGELFPF